MATPTVENYLKSIYTLEQAAPAAIIPMGKLAASMNVVPATATAMVKALHDARLITYEPRSGVHLTDTGRQLALHVLRRHRLIELFLVRTLGLDWAEVHAEAEELEHVVSDKVLERIDALLGHPSVDPHGDPIPNAQGSLPPSDLTPLAAAPPGVPVRIARLLDQEPSFLQFATQHGLTPGQTLTVLAVDACADALTVRTDRKETLTLSTLAAGKFLIQRTN